VILPLLLIPVVVEKSNSSTGLHQLALIRLRVKSLLSYTA